VSGSASRDEKSFYYRLRGVAVGPFSLEQMRHKAATAQVNSRMEVSRDSLTWGRGADFPEIFEKNPAPREQLWYYAVNGSQQGPAGLDVLRGHVVHRVLSANDYVMREGGSDWMTVSSVHELAVLLPQQAEIDPPSGRGRDPGPIVTIVTPEPPPTNGMAIAGFVCSLLGFVTVVTWPVGLVLSIIAINSPNRANRGLAIAGAIIGGVFTSFLLLWCVALAIVIANASAVM
jgi:hypothetical protein